MRFLLPNNYIKKISSNEKIKEWGCYVLIIV